MEMKLIGSLLVIIGLCLGCGGCAGSTGWRFEIGVSPVKSLNNQAGLQQEPKKPEKY